MQLNDLKKEIEKAWIEIIATCIQDARRKGSLEKVIRSRGRKEALDWIEHRLEFSKYAPGVDAVIQKFANYLSLQAPELPLEALSTLEGNEELALDILREKPKILVLKAGVLAGLVKLQVNSSLDKFLGGAKK